MNSLQENAGLMGIPTSPAFSIILMVLLVVNATTVTSRTRAVPVTASNRRTTGTIISITLFFIRTLQPIGPWAALENHSFYTRQRTIPMPHHGCTSIVNSLPAEISAVGTVCLTALLYHADGAHYCFLGAVLECDYGGDSGIFTFY